MKKISLVIVLMLFATSLFAQNVGIGTSNPNESALLDLNSTNKGLLPPRMTYAQRNSIASPAPGLMVWCTDCGTNGELCIFNGISWKTATMTETVAPNPCAGIVVNFTTGITAVLPCSTVVNNGAVILNASGGVSPYQYNFNGAGFSTNNSYSGLAAGNYTAVVKDANGCNSASQNISVGTSTAGPLFTAVKNILNTRCTGCHGSSPPVSGTNWTVDCNIVTKALRIKSRAVDANPGVMPPSGFIPASERQAITNWINAGGQYNQ